MTSAARSSLELIRTFALLGLLAGVADAQRANEELALDAEKVRLQQRGRDVLHPGDPLHVVGIVEGAPDFRAETPALADVDLTLAAVDRDTLRERRLALYEEGARFDRPVRTHSTAPGARAEAPPRERAVAPPEAAPADDGARLWPWIVAALVALGSAALLKVQQRATPRR